MPSRWLCLLILACWAAVTGWLYVRELEPYFRTNDPPPYVIELTAETQSVHPAVSWKIFQNDEEEESYHAQTWMDHSEEDDSFTLHAEMKPNPLLKDPSAKALLLVQLMKSEYRVSRDGKLLLLHVESDLSRRPFGMADLGFKPRIELTGIVAQGQINAHLRLPQLSGLSSEADSSFSFPVSQNGTIFLPLHPVHKIHNVRPGRTWTVPEINPLGDAARAWIKKKIGFDLPGKDSMLNARVRNQPEAFPYDIGDNKNHECWVIDYRGGDADKILAKTWVEVDTDFVLCQEAASESGNVRMVRDTASSKIR
jgi:hypothetical protein